MLLFVLFQKIHAMITVNQLQSIMQCKPERAALWIDHLNNAMSRFNITTSLRCAHFLAQVGHESGRLFYVKELASGNAYEGRADLGNNRAGDGIKFKGRGLIQITGRVNYQLASNALNVDFIKTPELLETKENAALSAAWFWNSRHLNSLADLDSFVKITRIINGGTNGLEDRRAILNKAKEVLGC